MEQEEEEEKEEEEEEGEGIAFHCMVSVFKYPIELKTMYSKLEYKKWDEDKQIEMNKVKVEGVYCFGGKDKHNKARNELQVLTVGTLKPL